MAKPARVGWLSALTGISPLNIRRLVAAGVIPAKRLPGSRGNWRFSASKLPEILHALAESGLVDEADVPRILEQAAASEVGANA